MQSVWAGDPSHARGSFYKQCAEEWNHSVKTQKGAVITTEIIKNCALTVCEPQCLSLTSAREFGLAPLSRSTLAMRWWPQCAATCRGVRWSSVLSSISALYCRSCLTQSMWSPCADMWIGERPFCKTTTTRTKDHHFLSHNPLGSLVSTQIAE